MAIVIDLQAWRERRERRVLVADQDLDRGRGLAAVAGLVPVAESVPRLDAAVARLERLMRAGTGRISARVEAELLAITDAVTAGRVRDAVRRAERLAERLEHPSSRLAR